MPTLHLQTIRSELLALRVLLRAAHEALDALQLRDDELPLAELVTKLKALTIAHFEDLEALLREKVATYAELDTRLAAEQARLRAAIDILLAAIGTAEDNDVLFANAIDLFRKTTCHVCWVEREVLASYEERPPRPKCGHGCS